MANIQNRKAHFDYYIEEKYEAGIVLEGNEIKSLRLGNVNMNDSFCFVRGNDVSVKNMHIAEYSFGSYNNHPVRRDRKLLLNKKEIKSLADDTKAPGFTIVPMRLFIDDNNRAKLVIGLCRGKKEYDKRATLKDKQDRREMDRAIKRFW